jgi:hypothetical protein
MRGALPGRGLILTDPLPFFFLPRLNSAPAGSGHWAFRWRRFHASYDLLLTPTLPLADQLQTDGQAALHDTAQQQRRRLLSS